MEKEIFELVQHITDVVEKNGKKSYRYYSEYKCKTCNNIIKISKSEKRRLETCAKCESEKLKIEFIGFKNEMYEVLKFSKKVGKKVYYIVKCNKCGGEIEMRKDAIVDNKKVSCTKCKGNGRKPKTDSVINVYRGVYIQGATSRSLSWELTDDQFANLIKGNCHYCGESPKPIQYLRRYNKTSQQVSVNGVDRKDSLIGYTIENCVPCCSMCNRMKMAFSYNDFLNQISKINKIHERSTTIETASNEEKGVEYTQVGGKGENLNGYTEGCDIV